MMDVSEKVARERELEKEYAVSDNQNLLVLLIFANDFRSEINWLAQALKTPPASIEETARILQGYGYLILVRADGNPRTQRAEQSSYDGKEYLRVTQKGKYLVIKIRSKLKAP